MKKLLLPSLFTAILSLLLCNAGAQIVISDDGSGTGTTTWTNNNIYILDGFVFVNEGQELTIEAGTVIKGMPGTGAQASALIVARGGKIFANGNQDEPIIFTFEGDPVDGSTPYDTRGQWGGLIVLGSAILNSVPGETQIEGIPETEPRGLYGGDNDDDNSGEIHYVSIRHGGTDIGAGNEINGLTLGGVGRETIIEHVEVVSNADDGIEFFGGTASVKWAVVSFCSDDSFDYDEGWRGNGQFWVTVQEPGSNGDRGGEHDGGTSPEDGTPYAHPVIFNATYVGRGTDAGKRALTFRDNAAGEYHNSIFYNWGRGIDIENLASGEDSYARFQDGDLAFANNCFWDVTSNASPSAEDLIKITMGTGGWISESDSTAQLTASSAVLSAGFTAGGNSVENPGLNYVIEENSGQLGLVPANDLTAGNAPSDPWFTNVNYRGALDPNDPCSTWLDDWTLISTYGFTGCIVGVEEQAVSAEFGIFPNPNEGLFRISFENAAEVVAVDVFDVTGKIVFTTNLQNILSGQVEDLNLEFLYPGIYIVAINADGAAHTSSFVKR